MIAPCDGCTHAQLREQLFSAPSHRGLLVKGRSQQFFVNGSGLTLGNKSLQVGVDPVREFHGPPVRRGCAAANIIAVVAIAAAIKRDRSRFWPLWLWPNVRR